MGGCSTLLHNPHSQVSLSKLTSFSLHAIHWNAGGQQGQHVDTLFEQEPGIVAITETWDFNEGHWKFDKRDNYHVFTSCRSAPAQSKVGRQHGGIALYLHDSLCLSNPRIKHFHAEMGILSVIIPHLKLAVMVCYFSPNNSQGYRIGYIAGDPFVHLASAISDLQNDGMSILILGDMNARVGTLTDYPLIAHDDVLPISAPSDPLYSFVPRSRQSFDGIVNAFGKSLMDTLRSSSLVLLNGRAPGDEMGKLTCKSNRLCDGPDAGSVVDVACVSVELYAHISSFTVCEDSPDGSSHHPLSFILDVPVHKSNPAKLPLHKKVKVLRPTGNIAAFYAASMQARYDDFDNISKQLMHHDISTSQAITQISSIITECMTSASIHQHNAKAQTSWSAPWWCEELTVARDDERRLRRLSRKSMADHQAWLDAKKSYRRLIKHHKMLFRQEHQMELIQSYFSESQGNFWKAINPPHAPCLLSDNDA